MTWIGPVLIGLLSTHIYKYDKDNQSYRILGSGAQVKDTLARVTAQHSSLGLIVALPTIPGHKITTGDISNWFAIQGNSNPAIKYGSIVDIRTEYGEPPSDISPEDPDETPYEAYDLDDNYLAAYHSLSDALLAIGNHYAKNYLIHDADTTLHL